MKKINSVKTAAVISAAAMLFCLAGVILTFAQNKTFDSTGCTILACNTAIFASAFSAYKKAVEAKNANITKM